MTVTIAELEALEAKGEAALLHYGVPGMKWGVSKAGGAGAKISSVSKKAASSAKTAVANVDKKKAAKIAGKVALGAAKAGALSSVSLGIGVPALVGVSAIASIPEVQLYAKTGLEVGRQTLGQFGVIEMSRLDIAKSNLKLHKYDAELRVRGALR